jgi:hypothetical protein
MAVYRLIALLADPDSLRCVKTQLYQARDVLLAELALHFSPFLALATHKEGVFHATQGRNTPTKKHKKAATAASLCVVVFGQTL